MGKFRKILLKDNINVYKKKVIKNVMFSTTRQWNPGDEFILFGTINLLKAVLGEFNPIIYNRNPDIRPLCNYSVLKNLKLIEGYTGRKELVQAEALFRMGFNDNSIKFDTDCSFCDLAVFAGSPETFYSRNYNFFEHIIKNNIPLIALGVGSCDTSLINDFEKVVYQKSLFVSVRDKDLINNDILKNAVYLPCPALFACEKFEEKEIKNVKTICLGMCVSLNDSVINQAVSKDTFDYTINLYKYLLKKYKKYKFIIVCHYVDEIYKAHEIFDRYGAEIKYSFDAKDYKKIYREADLCISPRVHACGMCASLCIPSINILHDKRGNTTKGFLSDIVTIDNNIEDFLKIFDNVIKNISCKSKALQEHKDKFFLEYKKYLSKLKYNRKIKYEVSVNSIPKYTYLSEFIGSMDDLKNLKICFEKNKG